MKKIPLRVPRQFGANSVGDICTIRVKGRKVQAAFLGSGRFSNVFGTEKVAYAFNWHEDHSKDILGDLYGLPHIPKVELIEKYMDKGRPVKVYRMTRYRPYTERKLEWEVALKKLRKDRADKVLSKNGRDFDAQVCYEINYQLALKAADYCPTSLVETLEELAFKATDYGEYLFDDFARRNLAADHKGNLVLLDPMFSARIVKEDSLARKQEYEQKHKANY